MSEEQFVNEQQVVQHFQKLQSEYNSIANTISELELEKRDHEYVFNYLSIIVIVKVPCCKH